MKQLTYVLGAGASYQSMPIVKTFPMRFKSFVDKLWMLANNEQNDITKKQLFDAHSRSHSLYLEFKSHQSFDTYFKKLFHSNPYKINMAKKILHLYFIWEHVSSHSFEKPKDENLFWKQSRYDKRYDALLAGLLKPLKDETELFCQTNFTTWNYDMNLLCSIKNYFYPKETFRIFMDKIKTNDSNVWEIANQIRVINMNGYFYSRYFDDRNDLEDANLSNTLTHALIQEAFLVPENEDIDANYIQFA